MDRISQLPDVLVHHILSFVNTNADLVRMSVLSKTWFHLTASFPILNFNIRKLRSRESFFKYVEYTTSRFCHHNIIPTQTFKLLTTIWEHAELDVVNRCLELLLLKNGVRELVISFQYSLGVPRYRLPNILLSVSVLTSLSILGCELPSSLMLGAVKFKSLIQLSLTYVPIDDEVITYLATSCPLLQTLHIDCCRGLKRFCVYGHQNLLTVRISYRTPIERIDIEAPNLSSLSIRDEAKNGAPRMNLASCKKLTSAAYMGHLLLDSNGFTDFLSNFPSIENLLLNVKYGCKNPNLGLFAYRCSYDSIWHMIRHSAHLKGWMQCYYNGYIETRCFQKLRRFLDKKNRFKVLNLYIHALNTQGITNLEELKAIELPPYEVEHVELQLDFLEESSAHIAFVDAVLWCCRPRSLTLRSSVPFEEQSDVVKFACKKLLEQEDQGHTNIQIVSPSSPKAPKHLMDLNALSMASPHNGETISFIKEEGTPHLMDLNA